MAVVDVNNYGILAGNGKTIEIWLVSNVSYGNMVEIFRVVLMYGITIVTQYKGRRN